MRRIILTALFTLATIGVVAASTDHVRASDTPDLDGPLFVTSMTPARNQETSSDLSDPGLNNQITVRFSTYLRASDVLDESNGVNGLSRKCAFLDQAFAPVRATALVRRNVLVINPLIVTQPVLPIGRYTVSLKPSIRSARGRLLNEGRVGFTTKFSVGSWQFPVVLLRVSPRDGQTDVGLRRTVVATFDRPMDVLSAEQSVRIEDRSTDPPTPIDALVTVDRNGYDVVVIPSPPGFAPGATIALVIQGRGTANDAPVLTTKDGIEFKRDWGPRWWSLEESPTLFHSELGVYDDATGEFTATFTTRAGTAQK